MLTLVLGLAGGVCCTDVQAQYDEQNVIDEAPPALVAKRAAPSQREYPDNFQAAEQALTLGLSRAGGSPTGATHNFPSAEQVRELGSSQNTNARPTIRRIKSSEEPNILDSIPEANLIDDQVDVPAPVAAKPASFTQPSLDQEAVAQRPASPAKKQPSREKTSALQEKIVAGELRIRELERQLREAKSQLAAAEIEITRLSSIAQNNARARLNIPANEGAVSIQSNTTTSAVRAAPVRSAPPVAEKVSDHVADLQVATISVEKADLRLGPGKNHSALMTLRQGSRLVIEARQGEWYRVFAPNGQRAWIHSSLVRFGAGSENLNDASTVRARGFDAALR